MNQYNELRLEKIQRKFIRYLYLKEYGYYPFLFLSIFILGALKTLYFQLTEATFKGKYNAIKKG